MKIRDFVSILSLIIVVVIGIIALDDGKQLKLHFVEGPQWKVPKKMLSFPKETHIIKTKMAAYKDKNNVISKIKNLHIPFIANLGQADEKVRFYADTFGGTVFVTEDGEIVYSLSKNSGHQQKALKQWTVATDQEQKGRSRKPTTEEAEAEARLQNPEESHGVALKESLVGAKIHAINGENKTLARVSYFKGNDPSQWQNNVSTYDVVSLGEIYDGIELKLKAYGNNVEKLFNVKPAADPENIRIKLKGNTSLRVSDTGELVAETELGDLKFTKPIAYQETIITGSQGTVASQKQNRKYVEVAYVVDGDEYGFRVGDYDRTKELVIDPLLASTFLGGGSEEYAYQVVVDSNGNIYVTGQTYSSNFPATTGVYSSKLKKGDSDVFISKLNSDLTSILASVFLGGAGKDKGFGLAIDASGNVYISGATASSDFPTTPAALDTSCGTDGNCSPYDEYGFTYYSSDAFIAKMDADLTTLLASTYLGGSDYDSTISFAIGPDGNIYVAGQTFSSDFSTTDSSYEGMLKGDADAFIAKLNPDLTTILASTFFGGTATDGANSITFNSNGDVYIAGMTNSSDFPVTPDAYDKSFDLLPASEAFISRFDADLTTLLASTYLGGYFFDSAIAIAADKNDNIYVAGETFSNNDSTFPVTQNAFSTSSKGGTDFFISKLNGDLSIILASTLFGGWENVESPEEIMALAIAPDGNVYIAGRTTATDFPVTTGAYDTLCGKDGNCDDDSSPSPTSPYDAFISKLSSDLTTLLASTYIGGRSDEIIMSLAFDDGGNVYATGWTYSPNFPKTKGSYDTSFNGELDGFVVKLDPELSSNNITYDLNISKSGTGNGTVTSLPKGINCGRYCTGSFRYKKNITLTAKPSVGSGFLEWGGACEGSGKTCTISMPLDTTVTASFIKYDPDISITQTSIDFGKVRADKASRRKNLQIINKGKGILRVGIATDSPEFSVIGSDSRTIMPGSRSSVGLLFSPTSTGPKTATLTIMSDDPESPTKTVTLKGTGK